MYRLCIGLLALVITASDASAGIKFYYDPATGNVAIDTSQTRNGALVLYVLDIDISKSTVHFLPENMIRLSSGSLFIASQSQISDSTQSTPWRGLYTIGNILPAGLSEEFWTTSFIRGADPRNTYKYAYNDIVGGGSFVPNPPDQFIYGPPQGEFKNRWDLVDPDTLTWAVTAKLIYKAESGEVLLDTSGETSGHISAFLLQSNDHFLPEAFTPFVDSQYVSAQKNLVSLFADAITPGVYSAGRILPSGLTQSELEAIISSAKFLGRAGFGGASFDFEVHGQSFELNYVAIPEPSSLAAIAGTLVGFGGVRCRRA